MLFCRTESNFVLSLFRCSIKSNSSIRFFARTSGRIQKEQQLSGQRWAKVAQKYHNSFAQSKAELNLWKDTESGNIDGQLDQVSSNVC